VAPSVECNDNAVGLSRF